MATRLTYAFGPYVFRPETLSLSYHAIKVPLMPRSAQLLGYLISHPERIVSKNEILDALWPDEDVNEGNLAQHVFLLRKTLARHTPHETFILTAAGQGYRFAAPVKSSQYSEHADSLAWRSYIRGRFFSDQRTSESLATGLEAYEEALRIDPQLAPALAGLASCHVLRAEYLFAPPSEMERARQASVRALAIDENNVEAQLALGDVTLFRDWDLEAAGEFYDRALSLDPGSSRVRIFQAWYDTISGRYDAAHGTLRIALLNDPLSLELMTTVAAVALHEGDYEGARRRCDEVLELDPTFALAKYYRRAALAYGPSPHDAVEAYDLDGTAEYPQQALAILGFAAARGGDLERAQRVLDTFANWRADGYLSPFNVAHVLMGLNRSGEAYDLLAQAIEQRDLWSVFLPKSNIFSALPRISALRGRVFHKPTAR